MGNCYNNFFFRSMLIPAAVLFFSAARAQNTKLDLNTSISLAGKNSLAVKIAQNTLQSAYWNFRYYRSGFLPKISLSGTMPDYYNTINTITLPDGQNTFVSQNLASSSLNTNILQNVTFTGGSLSFNTSLSRIDNFGAFRNTAYTSVPFAFSYTQDNLFYNDFKWQKKIEPLKFIEAQKAYAESIEDIALSTIDKYFTLLLAEVQLKLDQQNYNNLDTLLKVTQARFSIGTMQLNDVLQAKVSLLNAKKAISNSRLALTTAQQDFSIYVNLPPDKPVDLDIPDSLFDFKVEREKALGKARENRKFTWEFQRRKLTAEQQVSKVKAQTGPKFSINANLGVTQTGQNISSAYRSLLTNQSLVLSFYIPIIDWGINRSNRKRAEADLALEKNNIDQELLTIEQQIVYNVQKWNQQIEQMDIVKEVSKLAQRRYELAKQKYSSGSLTFTDFNNSQLEKDKAIIDYINNLFDYWKLYYTIRRTTLFDFATEADIKPPQNLNN